MWWTRSLCGRHGEESAWALSSALGRRKSPPEQTRLGWGTPKGNQPVRPGQPPRSITDRTQGHYGVTRKIMLLLSDRAGVVTTTLPLVAPLGTVAEISVFETTVNAAGVPLKLTAVALAKLLPRTRTFAPTWAEVGSVSTNGATPMDKLKTVPRLLAPPPLVVPYSCPLVACTSVAFGP